MSDSSRPPITPRLPLIVSLSALFGFVVFVLIALMLFLGSLGCAPARRPPQPAPVQPSWRLTVTTVDSTADGQPGLAGVVLRALDGPAKGELGTTDAAGQWTRELPQAGFTVCAHRDGYVDPDCQGVTLAVRPQAIHFALKPAGPPPARLAGRWRVLNGRFVDDRGPARWYGISEFELLHLALTGGRPAVLARLDQAVAHRQTNVRVFLSASILFHLTPDDPGFDEALTWLLEQAAARGLHVECVVFCDAQILYPKAADRERVLRHVLTAHRASPAAVWSLANEAFQNGWQEADDPKLLALAEITAGILGHRDFIVSDPADGDNLDASAATVARSITIARHANILALHPSRKGGAAPADGRFRRWIDHLEGTTDLLAKVRKATGRDVLVVLNEPMGHASRRFVPIPGRATPYEREYEAEAAVGAYATAATAGLPYTYHRIAFQDAGTPGLEEIAALVERIPLEGQYLNDSWPGSPSHGFSGWGKVRWRVRGGVAVGVAVGLTHGPITFANGFKLAGPPVFDRPHVQLLEARK